MRSRAANAEVEAVIRRASNRSLEFIQPGGGHPDYLYLKHIDRALIVGDLGCFFATGLMASSAVVSGWAAFAPHLAVIALATFIFSRILAAGKSSSADHRLTVRVAGRLVQALALTIALVAGLTIGLGLDPSFSREWLIVWLVSAIASVLLFRAVAAVIVQVAIRRGRLRRRVAIYGGDEQGVAVIEHLMRSDDGHYAVVGFYDDRDQRVPTDIKGFERRGGLSELEHAVERGFIDEVIIALPMNAVQRQSQILDRMDRYSIGVLLAPDLMMWRFLNRPFEPVGGAPMLRAIEPPIRGWAGVAKFFEDRIVASLLILLVSPVLLAAALAIRLDSSGPVLFRQPRRGWNGGVFTIYKFRTMHVESANLSGDEQTTRDDPRVTRVGRFLRRTSIDELPQLFNVLAGDMSLVGPRPHALGTKAEGKRFEDAVGGYMRRYRVKPGITGWAQVNGWRGETDTNDKLLGRVRYDVEYIENWTIWLDLYILLITPFSLLVRNRNAY